jgi:hypothetical protein
MPGETLRVSESGASMKIFLGILIGWLLMGVLVGWFSGPGVQRGGVESSGEV